MGENILRCDETIIELFSYDTKHFVWQNQHHPYCEVWWQPHEVRKQQNELKKANSRGQPALEYLRLFSAANVYIESDSDTSRKPKTTTEQLQV